MPPVVRWSLLAATVVLLAACHAIGPYLDRCESFVPQRYVIVLPTERQSVESVQEFAARRRSAGYDVQFAAFDPSGDARQRVYAVRDLLHALRPPPGQIAYALVLASHEELPMGPWRVVGASEPIHSDVPYFLTQAPDVMAEGTWAEVCHADFPWVIGRIPFVEAKPLARALRAGEQYAVNNEPRLAMLGGERFAVWPDTSVIMSFARERFEARGWRTLTYCQDWPNDIALGAVSDDELGVAHALATARGASRKASRAVPADLLAGVKGAEALLFMMHWVHLAPDIVYLNAHGAAEQFGQYLLSSFDVRVLLRLCRELELPVAPRAPAVLANIACAGGVADSRLLWFLFRAGWVCAMIGSTETTAPIPVTAAIRTEVQAADVLVSGLSVGLAMRAARRSYYEDARSTLSYHCFSSTAVAMARNVLGMTLYGDPSIALPTVAPGTTGR